MLYRVTGRIAGPDRGVISESKVEVWGTLGSSRVFTYLFLCFNINNSLAPAIWNYSKGYPFLN